MTAAELNALSAELTTDIATAEGITEQATMRGMIADVEGQELVAAIHKRKLDYMAPLPPLKQHPRTNLWEPAAVGFRDLPGGDAA